MTTKLRPLIDLNQDNLSNLEKFRNEYGVGGITLDATDVISLISYLNNLHTAVGALAIATIHMDNKSEFFEQLNRMNNLILVASSRLNVLSASLEEKLRNSDG